MNNLCESIPPSLAVGFRTGSLADAEFIVVNYPRPLSTDQAGRIREQIRGVLNTDIPILVFEGGASLEVVRSGGWVYTYEREPSVAGRYEVALALADHQDVTVADWEGRSWVGGLKPYAWRPVPASPPVRAERELILEERA